MALHPLRGAALLVGAILVAGGTPSASAVDDTTPPAIDTITHQPLAPHAYEPIVLTATARDESGIASLAWVFSDGGTASGASVQHLFTREGPVTATVTVVDGAGNSATASISFQVYGAQVEPSYTEPTLSRVRLHPRTISARGLTPDAPRRARLSFRLADLYDTTRVTLVLRGEETSARKTWRDVREGRRTVWLGPRVVRTLPPGRYRVTVRASNRYGSERSTARLRIVR